MKASFMITVADLRKKRENSCRNTLSLQAEGHIGRQIHYSFLYVQVLRMNHISFSYALMKTLFEFDE